MFSYETLAKADSMYNTPPTYSWYIAGLVFAWIKEKGGLQAIDEVRVVLVVAGPAVFLGQDFPRINGRLPPSAVPADDLADMTRLWSGEFEGKLAVYDYYLPVIGMVAVGLGKTTADLTTDDLPAIEEKTG